ncbi:MAG TPA: flavin reductase family protein [Eoetvoesiella sp.]|uniref:flavin reductase family protein n=1 Tax=Eoetvoesiella sp. TaxID=1966355 RepID=UPI002C4A1798|nr:flavin reductase family protein [Eoetvoesiella sp.]HWK63106.1 flavin reductase family protein [Eoetvoesiella sp.]
MTQAIHENFTSLPTSELSASMAYKLLTGVVVPRPVAWITTLGQNGVVNVAPFSSYNYVCDTPPMLAVNIAGQDDGALKDTARNIRETGEFVVNVATRAVLDLMNASSALYPSHASEAEHLGIATLPGRLVKVPRVAISPVQMECRLAHIVPLGTGTNTLYIGEVVMFHLDPAVYDGNHVNSVAIDPIARLGGPFYAALGEILKRPRPTVPQIDP